MGATDGGGEIRTVRHRRVLVVLSTPLTILEEGLFLSERAHVQTLEILAERFDDVAIVARCRTTAVLAAPEHIAVEATGARLALQLPDYGREGIRGAVSFLLSPSNRRAVTEMVRSADMLYVESPSLESVLVWSIVRRVPRPYVIEMRGETSLDRRYMRDRLGILGPLASSAIGAFFRDLRQGAAAAVFVGEQLRSRFAPPNGPSVAVSSVRLPPGCPTAPRSYDHPARRFLFVGHLEKVKAIPVILRAFALVGDQLASGWTLEIVGDGPERDALETLALDLGIAGRVTFRRRVAWGEELFRLFRDAEFLLMSSSSEGNSRTLIEGMAFGLPALSTAVGEAPRLLDAEALVPPGDVPAFARALARIANSPEHLSALSRNNVQRAAQFDSEVLRRRRATFFDELLRQRGKRLQAADVQ
jgi:glycosyltransferase involved in cell wall biosynthesis